jgi:hypothetical protein
MTTLQSLSLAIKKLGLPGTVRLLAEKHAKKRRLVKLLRAKHGIAKLITTGNGNKLYPSNEELITLIERADEMIRDENYVFTFLHHFKNIPDVWNYDPIEKKYWPKKRYEETRVHSADTPQDVKIVWEINRFKYLPLLAQAAYVTNEKKYADEIESRILSWIEDNPFAGTINWSSPLEIAIRGISWTATLRLLSVAGFDISKNEIIARSIWQHAAYLNAELSTDKIVRSNHLIGETAGLYILSSFLGFPEAVFYKLRAKKILTDSILKQTYFDGASRESSGWYHTFVTDFADLALRTARLTGDSFDTQFIERFIRMIIYRNSITLPDGDSVRYGDCDFGKAINLPAKWKEIVFGSNSFSSAEKRNYFEVANHITARRDKNYFFVRAGDFGWGGNGFSSHAHDDFLAPIVALDGVNILVDPGTYAYNGAPQERDKERAAENHNGLIVTSHGSRTGGREPRLKPNFGWLKTRPHSVIEKYETTEIGISVKTRYGETIKEHERSFLLSDDAFIVEDHLHFNSDKSIEWNFHFHPRWRLEKKGARKFALHDFRNNHYDFELSGMDAELEVLQYEFYPAYRQKSKAWKLRMSKNIHANNELTVRFILKKTNE